MTWATPSVGPFVRMAVSFAVRRGLAERLYDRYELVAQPVPHVAADEVGADVGDGGGRVDLGLALFQEWREQIVPIGVARLKRLDVTEITYVTCMMAFGRWSMRV